MLEKEIINYNLNFDIKSQPFKENVIEVNTILRLVPNHDVKHKILTEINLSSSCYYRSKHSRQKITGKNYFNRRFLLKFTPLYTKPLFIYLNKLV